MVMVLFGMAAHCPLKLNTKVTKTVSDTITSTANHLNVQLRLYQDTRLDSYVYIKTLDLTATFISRH